MFPCCSASTPETWAKNSHDNIYRAERERLASINLRALIDNILHDTSEDLRMQCDTVNQAFAKRCEELEDAKHKLEHHLKKVSFSFLPWPSKKTLASLIYLKHTEIANVHSRKGVLCLTYSRWKTEGPISLRASLKFGRSKTEMVYRALLPQPQESNGPVPPKSARNNTGWGALIRIVNDF